MGDVRLSAAMGNAMLEVMDDRIDAGAGAGTIKFYDGTRPTDPDTAVTSQNLLGTLTFPEPVKSSVASKVLTLNVPSAVAASATGTCTWARVIAGDGTTAEIDFDVGVTGSGAAIELNTVAFESGKNITITTATISLP